jgi:hypothetical protein
LLLADALWASEAQKIQLKAFKKITSSATKNNKPKQRLKDNLKVQN